MAKTITVGYFLEDIAHQRFIQSLVQRIAVEQGLAENNLRHDVCNATGGFGTVLQEFRRFLRDYSRGNEGAFDVIVAAIDGNCKGYVEKRNEVLALKEKTSYGGEVVCAIPDPHIEKWYMADAVACQRALNAPSSPACPAYKCERGRYKSALNNAIKSAGVVSLLGGAEYGPEIVAEMDLYQAGQNDSSLQHFIKDMQGFFAFFGEEPST